MKKLEEIFNLPAMEKDKEEIFKQNALDNIDPVEIQELVKRVDKIDIALSEVRGLEAEDASFDKYADMAIEAFIDLIDLGKNVEDRHAGDIFYAASNMMNNAISAKTNKVKKKLEMVRLQIRKGQLDLDNEKLEYYREKNLMNEPKNDVIPSEGKVLASRDQLIRAAIDELKKKETNE